MKKIMHLYKDGYSRIRVYNKDGSISHYKGATKKEIQIFLNSYYYNLFKCLEKARSTHGDDKGGRLGAYGTFTYIEYKRVWLYRKDRHSHKINYIKHQLINRPYKISIQSRPYQGYAKGSFLAQRKFTDPNKAFEEIKTFIYFKDLWEDKDLRKIWYRPLKDYSYIFDEEVGLFIKVNQKFIKYYPMEDKIW